MSTTCQLCGVEHGTLQPYKPVLSHIFKEPTPNSLRIAIVGEAPGETERLRGIPFVGESGTLLRQTLTGLGLNCEEILFTNVLCCQLIDDANPTAAQIDMGRIRLLAELKKFMPDRIIALGNTPMIALMGNDFQKENGRITDTRGCWYYSPYIQDAKIMPTFHPAYILREPIWFKDFASDCRKVNKDIVEFEKPFVQVVDNILDATSFHYHLNTLLSEYNIVCSIDIETTGFNGREDKILSIGISWNETESVIFTDNLLYSSQTTINLLQSLADDPRITWVGHNSAAFDIPFMELQLGLKFPVHFDTMLAHYATDERKRTHRLKTIARDRLNLPNYEHGLKKYLVDEGTTFADIPRDELYQYQAYDTCTTWKLYFLLNEELRQPKLRSAFENILMPAAEMLGEVRQNGVNIDVTYMRWLETTLREQLAAKVNAIRVSAGKPELNPNSTKQLAVILYDEIGVPKPPNKKDGTENRTTAAKWLQQLEEWNVNSNGIIPELLSLRKMAKILTTYVTGMLGVIHTDGKLRPNLNLCGTETGRLASATPNIQNIPRKTKKGEPSEYEYPYGNMIRYGFVPTPGYSLSEIDYSQLEFRCVAWCSQDEALIKAFNSGADFHTSVAAEVYNKSLADVTHNERFSMKAVNFGILYGRGAESLAAGELRELVLNVKEFEQCKSKKLRFEMWKTAVAKAQKFIDQFRARFPGNTQWIQETKDTLLKKKYVESPFGRRRRFPLLMQRNVADCLREGVNMVIQSMASDMCLMSGYQIHTTLPKDDVRILFFVHDAIMFEIKTELLDTYLPQIQHIMEHPSVLNGDYRIPWKVEIDVLGNHWNTPDDTYLEPYLLSLKNNL